MAVVRRCLELFGKQHFCCCVLAGAMLLFCLPCAAGTDPVNPSFQIPEPGDSFLHILSPTMLELLLINTEGPYATSVDSWDWVDNETNFVPPSMSSIRVIVNGQTNTATMIGFKRRPLYAPQQEWDLRIANDLYLQISSPISDGQSVQVINDGTVWPTNLPFTATADPMRYAAAIHVNQEGYTPGFPKKAIVGYYIGSGGELPVSATAFSVVNAQTGATVYQGTLTARPDVGYQYSPTPYQQVFEADFSSLNTPGQYRVLVPGMGGSLPFRIDPGIAMDFARTYALGIFEQRSGYDVELPYTRFTHTPDHTAPSSVPTNAAAPYVFTWETISNYAIATNPNNPPQTAPLLTNPSAQLYPFVNLGPVDTTGGHFEAGDYNRVTENSAQLIHFLLFGVDAVPGVSNLDNLGIPESGDGISDILQEVKWEADFLAKLQDTDGGFYYSVYSIDREYESDVLPQFGDPQVVWPKNTSCTAAAVAALAECSSSPNFKKFYPQAASNYWARAQLGWKFLTNAIAEYGTNGAYQEIQQFGDDFTDNDERSWAACEMFLATGDQQYQQKLFQWFPDPTDPGTFYWGWWKMYACYGNAVRDYATAISSGRLRAFQLNLNYLDKCIETITNCGNDQLQWSEDNAYGSSFPDETKAVLSAGWYFSPVQAYDLMVAQQFSPNPAYVDAIIQNINYEGGCNPVNVTYLTGLGWKRQRQIVDQYSENNFTALPKDGVPISNVQQGFVWTFEYGWDLTPLCFPWDGAPVPYPMYDRWCDFFNVTTEASTTDTARSLIVTAWLAAQTSMSNQAWSNTTANIIVPSNTHFLNQPITVSLQVGDTNLSNARITWEALNHDPIFGGSSYTFNPGPQSGPAWIEAEVQWPDGRRAFATNQVIISSNAPPQLTNPQFLSGGGFSFTLTGTPQTTYVIQASADMATWQPLVTNTLSASGVLPITDSHGGVFAKRYYRAVTAP